MGSIFLDPLLCTTLYVQGCLLLICIDHRLDSHVHTLKGPLELISQSVAGQRRRLTAALLHMLDAGFTGVFSVCVFVCVKEREEETKHIN